MAKDIALDENYDIDFNQQFVDDNEEIEQSIKLLFQTPKGSNFFDADNGIDTTYLLGKNFNSGYAEAAVRDALSQDDRVVANSVKVTADLIHRTLTVSLDLSFRDSTESMEVEINA